MQNEAPKACNVVQEWVDAGVVVNDEGEEVPFMSVCPVLFVGEFDNVFVAYNEIERGNLPHSGGYFDQPAKLMQFVKTVRSVINNRG